MKLIDILVEELPKRGGWMEGVEHAWCDHDGEIRFRNGGCKPDFYPETDVDIEFRVPDSSYEDDSRYIITRDQYEAALAAKNNGWIEWGGGECPVPCGTAVDVKHRCGDVSENQQAWPLRHHRKSSAGIDMLSKAGYAFWRHDNLSTDIIAYRLHHPQEAEQAETYGETNLNECIGQTPAPVWSGEGLPPVGCECEVSVDGGRSWCTYRAINEKDGARLIEIGNFTEEFQNNNWVFRPIRSEAERKRDAATNALMGILGGCGGPHSELKSGEIYDAIAAGKIPGVKLED